MRQPAPCSRFLKTPAGGQRRLVEVDAEDAVGPAGYGEVRGEPLVDLPAQTVGQDCELGQGLVNSGERIARPGGSLGFGVCGCRRKAADCRPGAGRIVPEHVSTTKQKKGMKFIILNPEQGVSHTIRFPRRWLLTIAAGVLMLPLLGAVGGYLFYDYRMSDPVVSGEVGRSAVSAWRERISGQRAAIVQARNRAEDRLKALTVRVAEMQAKLLRLDALGERLVRSTGLGKGAKEAFDFGRPPSMGGPEEFTGAAEPYRQPDFLLALDEVSSRIDIREAELLVLERLLAGSRLHEESFLAGNPVSTGYLSSAYGRRIDPFHGQIAFHHGVDFAGPSGSDIVATGAGIVVYAGAHAGYGNMVEISHGDGISTVYAHASKVLVQVGDIVRERQVVALMGSTGRSTGPHVHYEVRRNGQTINPASYVASMQL